MQNRFLVLTIFLFLNLIVVDCVIAEEIKIYDSQGLIRAFSKIATKAGIEIKLNLRSGKAPDSILITHMDGLSADRTLSRITQNQSEKPTYGTLELDPGSWKITMSSLDENEQQYSVYEVKILD